MEYSLFSKEKVSGCKKKVIPWHVQKRYMESFSQLSLNQTISTAFYKKEIKSLKRNNRHLALALQRSRYLATDKENLLIENGKILDIVNFSRVKLMDMATNMKQATACLDETLLLLNSATKRDIVAKCSPTYRNYRSDLKNKIQELKIEPINEIKEFASENSESFNNNAQSCVLKGKISRVDDCISSPNKKCKFGKKEKIKRNSKVAPKASASLHNSPPKNITKKDPKKSGSQLIIKSQIIKKSLPKSSIEPPSSSKLPSSNPNLSTQAKNKGRYQNKKCKPVKVMLTDIAEDYHSPKTSKTVSTSNANLRCFSQNSLEDDVLIKNSEITGKEISSPSNSHSPLFASTTDNTEAPNGSQDASNSSNVSINDSTDTLLKKKELLDLPSENIEGFVCDQTGALEEVKNDIKQCVKSCIKNSDSDKDKRHKPCGSTVKRAHFYFDEDSIEEWKAKKTASNVKNTSFKNMGLKSNCILPDNVSKLGKNSFLVTAEVHSPPNSTYAKEMKSKLSVTEKKEPCVVLTDIFKSNRGLLSEMVGNALRENGCIEKTILSSESSLGILSVNNTANMDFENNAVEDHLLEHKSVKKKVFLAKKNKGNKNICKKQSTFALIDIVNRRKELNKCFKVYSNKKSRKKSASSLLHDKENRCFPEIEIREEKKQRRRAKLVSYKEPSLHTKMRRLF